MSDTHKTDPPSIDSIPEADVSEVDVPEIHEGETPEVVDTLKATQNQAETASDTDSESGESEIEQPIEAVYTALQREYGDVRSEFKHFRVITNTLESIMVEGAEELIAIYGVEKFVKAYFDVASEEKESPTMLKVIKKLEPKKAKRKEIYDEMLTKAEARREAMQETMPEHDWLAHTFEQRLVYIKTYEGSDSPLVRNNVMSNSFGHLRETFLEPADISDIEQAVEDKGGDLYALATARREAYEQMEKKWYDKVEEFMERKDEEIERVTRETTSEFEETRGKLENDLKALQTLIDSMSSDAGRLATNDALEKIQIAYVEVSPQALRPEIERRIQPLEEMFETRFKI